MHANWIVQTTTSTGTGGLTLAAVTGCPGFYDLFGQAPFVYAILDDTTELPLETGIGHMTSSTAMVRDRVTASYSGSAYDNTSPAAVSLAAGTKRVICVFEEADVMPTIPNVQNAFGQRIVIPDGIQLAGNTKALGANQMVLSCLRWNCSREIASLVCDIATLSGAGTDHLQLGIYATDHNGLPGPLICRTGDIAPNTTGVKTAALSGGNFRLPPGWYWWAMLCNVTPTMRCYAAGSSGNAILSTPMGAPAGSSWNTRYGFFTATIGAGWTNLPSSVTLASAVQIASDFPPIIGALLP